MATSENKIISRIKILFFILTVICAPVFFVRASAPPSKQKSSPQLSDPKNQNPEPVQARREAVRQKASEYAVLVDPFGGELSPEVKEIMQSTSDDTPSRE
ncbi:MAG: hypothetical protein H6757_03340 [Candidatus Omnitrophica bacterium]|nr:hypothetical protein [Candidatus Omnitrophota bacterium]